MDKDLLAVLEERWGAMAEAIRLLRGELVAVKDELQAREELMAGQEEALERLRQQNSELQKEKARIVDRIEGLLARFSNVD